MYDIRWIRENAEAFDRGLQRRGLEKLSSSLLALDDQRRAAIGKSQAAQERRNALSKEIGKAMGQKDLALADQLKAEVAALKEQVPALEAEEKAAVETLNAQLAAIPNKPFDDVPEGADEHGNVEYSRHGVKPEEAGKRLVGVNQPKEHFELGEALGQMDFETAAKLSGSRFVVLERQIARLSRAIGQFMLDTHVEEHGYTEVNPPLMVRDEVMFGTAQLPKFDYDQFRVTRTGSLDSLVQSERSRVVSEIEDSIVGELGGSEQVKIDDFLDSMGKLSDTMKKLGYSSDAISSSLNRAIARLQKKEVAKPALPESYWLIPTAEVPLTNLVRESILSEEELPRRFTALTPCFRAEAGSAGRDTRGMLRQHQFEKVELVSITAPEKSREEHERMLSCAENVLKKLDLHYRVMTLCTGDMGFASQKTYDIEVWLPGQKTYREISSCSVCGDFQARRMNARYKTKDGKGPFFVHTLNGSGTAVGRALIAVMENYQNADGSITVPEVLVPYMRGVTRIEKAA
ncbi:Serine--tRNA ligase [Bosea sp. 62]|uniref:serine--tRNA ligase n=1 Tax=unclassified Bosea (in: a-proteobacteria) TaxID=2653178 RepID=UPI001254DCB8|nr:MULTISPECIES: serine--tRNA ligase [unclassified Bosea (in: a-proteobacteria)]CAD5255417.1 Serine--tRNA ligase [Bosea sp. 21B]CAD5284831.1 Serine--tRNA ligase [Bosea sp. 7B]CAD5301641.1 Serine--tRNA ligase [Bosea sp. 46]VVT57762.1 Serine--tRNA ligase [Bosea sp. EC-HK365B]VXB30794.1 Serine--tRNA ligase [Bosea sp. 29B]